MTIPGFTSTGSKRPDLLFGDSPDCPRRMVRSEGCRVWDESGREHLDMIMGLGAVTLGYGHPSVVAAAERAIRAGIVGPIAPVVEQEVAERLVALIPGAESVRFLKTGAEAVAAAVRIARTATGRERVITCGYHGWLDWCQDSDGVPRAVRELRREVLFNDIGALKTAVDEFAPVAAIVVEPVIEGPPNKAWLDALRELAIQTGAVLIFDEIKTAFRIANGGAAERYGVVPDLIVVGKALGNGFPISAVCGPSALMDAARKTWISSTLATEHVSLAAALAVLNTYESEDVTGHLRSVGKVFWDGLASLSSGAGGKLGEVRGMPELCYLSFVNDGVSEAFAVAAAARGVLFKRSAYNFVSLAHSIDVIGDINARLAEAAEEVQRSC